MKFFAFDTETYLFLPGLSAPRLVCGSYADATSEHITSAADTVTWFRDRLDAGDHLVGINIAYDIAVMAAGNPELLPRIFKAGNAGQFHCCSVREALHDIAIDKLFTDYRTGKSFAKRDPETGEMSGRYSMAVLMQRHFGIDISDEKTGDVWRYKYASLDGVALEQWPAAAVSYPKQDVRRTFDIWNKSPANGSKRWQNLHDEPAQTRAAIALTLTSAWGFRTDGAYLDWLEADVDRIWNEAREEFTKVGIFKPDGVKDTIKLKSMVTAAYAGNPPKTPGGDVSTDRDTLADSGDPVLERLAAAGKNDKRKTTYIPALRKGVDRPINPQFNSLVNTGRLSSDWQQLPQKGGLRESIIARPGKVNGSLDYGGLELRTMSQRAILHPRVRFSKMAEFINSGKDPHCYVAGFFIGIDYEEAKRRHETKAPGFKAFRDIAKIFNFGAGGGAGAFAIAYNAKVKDNIRLCLSLNRATKCGVKKTEGFIGGKTKRVCALCVDIAKELKAKWLKAWPEQGLLTQIASELTAKGRKVESVTFGSNRVRGGCGFSQWLNNPFQGAGGDGMKAAMWKIQEDQYTNRRSPLWGSRIILNIHDELWIEFPDEPQRRHDAAFLAAKIMVDTMDAITPDAKNECVPALMRRMFKSASDVYDQNRNLKPWWPTKCDHKTDQHSLQCATWQWQPDSEVMQTDLAA